MLDENVVIIFGKHKKARYKNSSNFVVVVFSYRNAYFLIFLITSAALTTFAIPPSNTHGRLQITCTLLLTSVTFRWVVNKSLPYVE